MANNVRYQIFVSSTYTDLFPVRRQVTEHILSMNHIPAGMEMFSASGRQQWTTIQKAIDNSDYYVLIIGERYGSISPEDGISYTEKEFNYALSKNIPTLCFLPGKNFSTSRENRETDPIAIEKLECFKDRVKEQLCDFWEDGNELINKVSAALYKIFTDEPGIGWIRGDASDPEALTKLIHAMEENKNLSKRISFLEEQNKRDLPILSLQINGHDFLSGPLEIELPEPNDIGLFIPDLVYEDIPSHLIKWIERSDLEDYNTSKPTRIQVDEHNESTRFYLSSLNGKLNFTVRNDGPVKANNVSVRISLADGIKFMDEQGIEGLKKPELKFPINILDIAEKKYQSQLKVRHPDPLAHFTEIVPHAVPRSYSALRLNSSTPDLVILKDGTISGRKMSVRQATTETLSSEAFLVPEKRGSFLISVEILCDEYREWQVSTLEFIIK